MRRIVLAGERVILHRLALAGHGHARVFPCLRAFRPQPAAVSVVVAARLVGDAHLVEAVWFVGFAVVAVFVRHEMQLAHLPGVVSGLAQDVGQRHLVVGHHDAVGDQAVRVGVASGHQRGAVRRTGHAHGVVMEKGRSAARQFVDMRRHDGRIAVGRDVVPTQMIAGNQDDMRQCFHPLGDRGRGIVRLGKRRQSGQEKSRESHGSQEDSSRGRAARGYVLPLKSFFSGS